MNLMAEKVGLIRQAQCKAHHSINFINQKIFSN